MSNRQERKERISRAKEIADSALPILAAATAKRIGDGTLSDRGASLAMQKSFQLAELYVRVRRDYIERASQDPKDESGEE